MDEIDLEKMFDKAKEHENDILEAIRTAYADTIPHLQRKFPDKKDLWNPAVAAFQEAESLSEFQTLIDQAGNEIRQNKKKDALQHLSDWEKVARRIRESIESLNNTLSTLTKPETDSRQKIKEAQQKLSGLETLTKDNASNRTLAALNEDKRSLAEIEKLIETAKIDWDDINQRASKILKHLDTIIIPSVRIDNKAAEAIKDKTPDKLLEATRLILKKAETELREVDAAQPSLEQARKIFEAAGNWQVRDFNAIDVEMEMRRVRNLITNARTAR